MLDIYYVWISEIVQSFTTVLAKKPQKKQFMTFLCICKKEALSLYGLVNICQQGAIHWQEGLFINNRHGHWIFDQEITGK